MQARSHQTRAGAWLEAIELLLEGPVYNLVLEVQQPSLVTNVSRAIELHVDAFLLQHDCQSIHTVAETIFPAAEYLSGGLPKLFKYPKTVFPHIQSIRSNSKGTYALRLVERKCSDGSTMNPLEIAIKKLRKQLKTFAPKRAVYELDLDTEALELKLYEAELDHANHRSGQCLSHISIKLGPERELYLTALYRYQYFVQKALGNLKGLARLQACIAHEVGVPLGPLVCHATLAAAEVGKGTRNAPDWGVRRLEQLVRECRAIEQGARVATAA
jgi:hypothetical protein